MGGGGRICLVGDLTKYTESGLVLSTSGPIRYVERGWGGSPGMLSTSDPTRKGRFGVLFHFAVIRFSPDTKSVEGGSASQQGGCVSERPAYAN